ncbi:MAG: hypothetical protein RBT11_11165 [Desulfobacterales bacterium]|jgi:DNA polymerase-3 subunit delta|nr:hypothetical protein [Desulfobacterales bacterium]
MPEINYKQFDQYLEKTANTSGANAFAPVYLIFGEEMLYKKAHDAIVNALLPTSTDRLNHEKIAGDNENIPDVINRMNTYSLLAGTKVVSFQDAALFYTAQNKDKLLETAKSAWQNSELKKAAGCVLNAMVKSGITLDDLQPEGQGLSLLSDNANDAEWLLKILAYCRENQLSPPSEKDYMTQLQEAVEKGFPKKNHLIITTDLVDKRRSQYNSFKEYGVVIDCSVPKGNRQADRQIQEEVLRERANSILVLAGKKLEPRALSALMEMTGFDLRTFSGNLEKLVLFAGKRATITSEDVTSVLDRTREDPIFEFTGAVSDRNLEKALFFLKSLLSQNSHPLQLLTALVNHFRKLILAKEFTGSGPGRVWRPGMEFTSFKTNVLPVIQACDAQLLETTEHWDSVMDDPDAESEVAEKPPAQKKKKEKKKKNPAAELAVAQNPGNPYPIYLMLKKADLFSMDELLTAYARLSDSDIQLKSTGQNPQVLLESLIIHICSK